MAKNKVFFSMSLCLSKALIAYAILNGVKFRNPLQKGKITKLKVVEHHGHCSNKPGRHGSPRNMSMLARWLTIFPSRVNPPAATRAGTFHKLIQRLAELFLISCWFRTSCPLSPPAPEKSRVRPEKRENPVLTGCRHSLFSMRI